MDPSHPNMQKPYMTHDWESQQTWIVLPIRGSNYNSLLQSVQHFLSFSPSPQVHRECATRHSKSHKEWPGILVTEANIFFVSFCPIKVELRNWNVGQGAPLISLLHLFFCVIASFLPSFLALSREKEVSGAGKIFPLGSSSFFSALGISWKMKNKVWVGLLTQR